MWLFLSNYRAFISYDDGEPLFYSVANQTIINSAWPLQACWKYLILLINKRTLNNSSSTQWIGYKKIITGIKIKEILTPGETAVALDMEPEHWILPVLKGLLITWLDICWFKKACFDCWKTNKCWWWCANLMKNDEPFRSQAHFLFSQLVGTFH